ncbi:endonuclease/exonuclease/phosphatase family protein [Marinilabilia salmonicolor]|uniref:endonuclease/exonuclease/phosphatase family protein n=1 Tax=Marinilabilia salmonicolor TaxID=989 RepID=UPI00029A855E|nr:endonuclease/exonuclease/phosphatase family protein [Marinilabilia salmonicolor]
MKKLFLLAFYAVFLLGCDPFGTSLDADDIAYYASHAKKEHQDISDTLSVMTWNIKFGGGRINFFFDCHGNRVIMDSSEVFNHLEGIAAFINHHKPDFLFVQEADVDSRRSAFSDQIQWILEHTGFNYAVYTPQWKADYIPSKGLGKMNSGNAIFSRTPLWGAKRISLSLIEEQNCLVRYFYLKRCLMDVSTVVNGDTLHLLNTHLAAYSSDGTKKKQIDQVFEYADSLRCNSQKFLLAGDFNALPPGTRKLKGFPDSACTNGDFEADDYSGEEQWMMPFYEVFNAAVPLERYQDNNLPFFTHTTDKNGFWNRKLDYIFSNLSFVPGSMNVIQRSDEVELRPMSLSDHCAVKASLVLIED